MQDGHDVLSDARVMLTQARAAQAGRLALMPVMLILALVSPSVPAAILFGLTGGFILSRFMFCQTIIKKVSTLVKEIESRPRP